MGPSQAPSHSSCQKAEIRGSPKGSKGVCAHQGGSSLCCPSALPAGRQRISRPLEISLTRLPGLHPKQPLVGFHQNIVTPSACVRRVCQCHQQLNFRIIISAAHLRGFCLIWANSRGNSDTGHQVRCHICPSHTRGRALCQQSSPSPSPQTRPALHPAPPRFD